MAETAMGAFIRVEPPKTCSLLIPRWSITYGYMRPKSVRYLKYSSIAAYKMSPVQKILDNASRRAAFVLFKMALWRDYEPRFASVMHGRTPNLTWLLPTSFNIMAGKDPQQELTRAEKLIKKSKFKKTTYPSHVLDLNDVPAINDSVEEINIIVMFRASLKCRYLPITAFANSCEIWFIEDLNLAYTAYKNNKDCTFENYSKLTVRHVTSHEVN